MSMCVQVCGCVCTEIRFSSTINQQLTRLCFLVHPRHTEPSHDPLCLRSLKCVHVVLVFCRATGAKGNNVMQIYNNDRMFIHRS